MAELDATDAELKSVMIEATPAFAGGKTISESLSYDVMPPG